MNPSDSSIDAAAIAMAATRRLRDALEAALDDLPRYFAVCQHEDGQTGTDPYPPEMICCVTVDDAREMLRRTLASTTRNPEDRS